jgi:23S rRNA pseudouridine2605 synthase
MGRLQSKTRRNQKKTSEGPLKKKRSSAKSAGSKNPKRVGLKSAKSTDLKNTKSTGSKRTNGILKSKKTSVKKKNTLRSKNVNESTEIRLNKFLSLSGVCSRRKADEHIQLGDVRVNGKVVTEMGYKVNPKIDSVLFKRKKIKPNEDFTYVILFKPRNFITTLNDPHGRPTVLDLVPKKLSRMHIFPVGRLDWASEGLLVLTNDGAYAQKVLHPKQEIPKSYEVKVEGEVPEKYIQKLLRGVSLDDGKAKAIEVKPFRKSSTGSHTWLRITVTEGRNKLIRRMLERLGLSVMRLRRISIGRLKIGHLKAGDWAYLNESQKDLALKSFLKD